MRANDWLLACSAVAATYVVAQGFSQLNEHFDALPPEVIQATVVGQHTRYTPFPIRIVTAKDALHQDHQVDVLPALAFSLKPGDSLGIVSKRGWLGKPWLQDEERFESLRSGRQGRGALWIVILAGVLLTWLFIAPRLRAWGLGYGGLGLAVLVATVVFWWLL